MALTICTCTLTIKDQLGAAYSTAELVFEPRKSQVNTGDAIYINKPQRATAVAGVCTLALSETTTNNQQCIFTLNWNDGSNYNSIVFDPVLIPNQASVDLSTLLTVSRG
jgi:hypothetical protein